jgi:transposase
MVDLTRGKDGCLHARLLDAVVGRSGTAYKSWLQNQPKEFTAGMIPNLVGSSKRLSLLSTGV